MFELQSKLKGRRKINPTHSSSIRTSKERNITVTAPTTLVTNSNSVKIMKLSTSATNDEEGHYTTAAVEVEMKEYHLKNGEMTKELSTSSPISTPSDRGGEGGGGVKELARIFSARYRDTPPSSNKTTSAPKRTHPPLISESVVVKEKVEDTYTIDHTRVETAREVQCT